MTGAIEHEAEVQLAKARATRHLSALEAAQLALIDELRAQAQGEEIQRLERIEEAAWSAFHYHISGRSGERTCDETWDADVMIEKLDALGDAL